MKMKKYEIVICQKNRYGGEDDIHGELDNFEDVNTLFDLIMKAFPNARITATITESNNNVEEEDE